MTFKNRIYRALKEHINEKFIVVCSFSNITGIIKNPIVVLVNFNFNVHRVSNQTAAWPAISDTSFCSLNILVLQFYIILTVINN